MQKATAIGESTTVTRITLGIGRGGRNRHNPKLTTTKSIMLMTTYIKRFRQGFMSGLGSVGRKQKTPTMMMS